MELVRADLSDPAAIERAVREVEVVYHIAAKIDPPGTHAEFFETNVRGTERVLQACLRAGVRRAVCISSIAVYGLAREGEPINEDTPYDDAPEKRDFYSQSKIASDRLAVSFAEKTGLPVAILRPGVVHGPGRPLPAALLAFRLGKTDFVFGNRNHRIPLSYIENLIDAVQLVAGLRDGKPRQYIVVDDENLTLGQYHAAKREAAGTRTLFLPGWPVLLAAPLTGPPPRQVKRALQNRWYDTRRIRQETGWAPKVPLREAIQRTLTPPG